MKPLFVVRGLSHENQFEFAALDLLRGMLATQEKAFGHSHAALIPVLRDLALVQAALGDHLGAHEQVEWIRSIRAAFPLPDPLGRYWTA